MASGNGFEELVAFLLDQGCDAGVEDGRGDTPLMWAARNGGNLGIEEHSGNYLTLVQAMPIFSSISSGRLKRQMLRTKWVPVNSLPMHNFLER